MSRQSSGGMNLGRRLPQVVDHHVCARLRVRRIMLGLTQQDLATLVGVTPQQAHKYEIGSNRISAGMLHRLAQALKVEVAYFFADLNATQVAEPSRSRRVSLELARSFLAITNHGHQQALCGLARVLAGASNQNKPSRRKSD